MQQTNKTCAQGYTLLELMVILAILGLITGLAAPRMQALYASMRNALAYDDFLQEITNLNYNAYQQGKTLRLTADTVSAHLDVPTGWTVNLDAPITYYPTGVCGGGALSVNTGTKIETWKLSPPRCVPTPVTANK